MVLDQSIFRLSRTGRVALGPRHRGQHIRHRARSDMAAGGYRECAHQRERCDALFEQPSP
eukprot:SAG31_NODE_6850_length_1870_cov_1.686053_3_plen_59_part_01